jgi:hypothetical protein
VDVSQSDCVNQLRLLHYPAVENSESGWRHGSHTDIGGLTLLFQRDGEDGLEVLPGRETHTSKVGGGDFFPVAAKTGPIIVNIGDMLSKFDAHCPDFLHVNLTKLGSGLVRRPLQGQFPQSPRKGHRLLSSSLLSWVLQHGSRRFRFSGAAEEIVSLVFSAIESLSSVSDANDQQPRNNLRRVLP